MMQQNFNDLNVPFANDGNAANAATDSNSSHYHESQQHAAPHQQQTSSALGHRLAILITGVLIGLFIFFPNVMIMDSGTALAGAALNFGMMASVAFIIGGIIGAIINSWYCLVPGTILQITVFILIEMNARRM